MLPPLRTDLTAIVNKNGGSKRPPTIKIKSRINRCGSFVLFRINNVFVLIARLQHVLQPHGQNQHNVVVNEPIVNALSRAAIAHHTFFQG